MAFVSYAQNFEDVMLWRALRGVKGGFYIDVGAWSPDLDSVTRAFSERGWRGINVEPDPVYFAQLTQRRAADINLNLALGDRFGRITMNWVTDSGLSTADAAIARKHAAAGWRVTQGEVDLRPLREVWQTHVPPGQAVHFLKIDVEGLEGAVLAGNDWTRCRPWIVVVEATEPNSQVESHAEWQPLLIDVGYSLVYWDGLNRFYLAHEHAELRDKFSHPPNVFDDFVTARTVTVDDPLVGLGQDKDRKFPASSADAAELRKALRAGDAAVQEANARVHSLEARHQGILVSAPWRIASLLIRAGEKLPPSVKRIARRSVKAGWWALTPWRLPARLEHVRSGRALALGRLDLASDEALSAAAGLPATDILWSPAPPGAVVDRWSAVRYSVDLLRKRPDIRQRFPKALSQPKASGFADWLATKGGPELGLSAAAADCLQEILGANLGARARQMFMFRADVRAGMPHGLTPPGQAALWRWFMREARAEHLLRTEEILWLFLEAAEDPSLELVRAFRFAPDWQRKHPAGLTAFGRQTFVEWFVAAYKVADPSWIVLDDATVGLSAARQLRQAHAARSDWQAAHPHAFDDEHRAAHFIEALRSGALEMTAEQLAWCRAIDVRAVAAELSKVGVNLIGHFCCPSGLRISAESLASGMELAGIERSLRDIRTDATDEPRHVHFDALEDFDTTIIHTQPAPFFRSAYALADLNERSPRSYRIAYWYWEFDSIPADWIALTAHVDEVWAATEFVAKGLRDSLSIPVRTLFPGVRLAPYERRPRGDFGIEEVGFAFLFNFHMNSVMERKNPLGLVRAFRQAFSPEEPVTLVLKTMFGHKHPELMGALRQACADARVRIIDETYSPEDVLALTDACDAYVSLHRSEGLGLTMAEAMLMGKPVIATNYSGNVDFMDATNSVLIPYELVSLGRALPPYDAHLTWAEPSVEHAASAMRRLVDNPEWAAALGARAKQSAQERLSVEAAGQRVAMRLAEIRASRQ